MPLPPAVAEPSEADRLRGLLEMTTDRRDRARLRGLLQLVTAKVDGRKTDEARQAARARAALQWTPDARRRQGDLTRQKLSPPAVRERISVRTREALANPDVRQRQLDGLKKAMARPEVRARISEGTRAGMARWRAQRLAELREAWRRSDNKTHAEFLAEIGSERASKFDIMPNLLPNALYELGAPDTPDAVHDQIANAAQQRTAAS